GEYTTCDAADGHYSDGARFDPGTNKWSLISTTGAPAPCRWDTAYAFSGTQLLAWGGNGGDVTGAIYDLPSDKWTATGTDSALVEFDTGGIYDPVTDTWTAMSMDGAPPPRVFPYAIWTGDKLVIWGGLSYSRGVRLGDGAVFDPDTNRWVSTIPDQGAP